MNFFVYVFLMATNDIQYLTTHLVKDENTEELSKFWSKKYQYILTEGLFELSQQTIDIIEAQKVASYIPSGSIQIEHHLKEDGSLDEDKFVATIEVAVRLLDGVVGYLAELGFDHVLEYRNISLSLNQLDLYLKEESDIEYIAGLVGESAYRASEFIADEKGAFEKFKDIKYSFRGVMFDSWVTLDGTITNLETFDGDSTEMNGLCLVERRNYALLGFDSTPELYSWRDPELGELEEEAEDMPDSVDDIEVKNHLEQPINTDRIEPQFQIKIEDTPPYYGPTSTPKKQVNKHIDQIFQHLLKEQKEQKTLKQTLDEYSQKTGVKPQVSPSFVAQNQTAPTKLSEDQSNIPVPVASPEKTYKVKLHVIIEHRGKYIFFKDQNKLALPNIELENDKQIAQKIRDGLLKKYNLLVKVGKEFGVHIERKNGNFVNIGYEAELENHTLPNDLFWTSPGNGDFLTDVSFGLILKYQELTALKPTQPEVPAVKIVQQFSPAMTPENSRSALPVTKSLDEQNSQSDDINPYTFEQNGIKKSPNSKITFGLRLNQKIQTITFGTVEIVFEYSKECPQIIEYSCEIISEQDKHATDVIISLINLLILRKYDIDKLEEYLETRVKTDENNTINNFITVLVFAFRETPSNIQDLKELVG